MNNHIELNRETNQYELREKSSGSDVVAALRGANTNGEPDNETLKAVGDLARNSNEPQQKTFFEC